MGSPARRCSTCALDWPSDYSAFKTCHKCGGKTDSISNGNPLDPRDALSLKNHLEFDRFCDARDERRAAEATKQAQAAEADWQRNLSNLEAAVDAAPSIPDPSGAEGLMELPAPVKADEKPKGD
jgi:hypothetical protein